MEHRRRGLIHPETINRICLYLLRRVHVERGEREKEAEEGRCAGGIDKGVAKAGMEKRRTVLKNFVKLSHHSDEL